MIKVVGVIKSFDNVKALDGVSCKIRPGSIYGMLGSNGAGKSTLLRIIAGVMKPDGGTVLIEDLPVFDHPAIKERVFLVPDDPYFIGQSSMQDMARFYARFYPAFDWDIYHQLADRFPIDAKRRMNTFSKGMVRQVFLILAFATKPRYLLLDEAFDGLDAVMRRALGQVITEWVQSRGLTVVVASHNLRELEDTCDTVGLLHRGGILFEKGLDDLKDNFHRFQFAYADGEPPLPEGLDVVGLERRGRLITLVARGDVDEILTALRRTDPSFLELLPLTLEEAFIQEMEVAGYDANNILF